MHLKWPVVFNSKWWSSQFPVPGFSRARKVAIIFSKRGYFSFIVQWVELGDPGGPFLLSLWFYDPTLNLKASEVDSHDCCYFETIKITFNKNLIVSLCVPNSDQLSYVQDIFSKKKAFQEGQVIVGTDWIIWWT